MDSEQDFDLDCAPGAGGSLLKLAKMVLRGGINATLKWQSWIGPGSIAMHIEMRVMDRAWEHRDAH